MCYTLITCLTTLLQNEYIQLLFKVPFLKLIWQVQDKGLSDEEVGKMIIQKLKDTSVVVSFAEIANAALKEGRNGLATQVCVCVCVCVFMCVCVCVYVCVCVCLCV